jgi:serine/threonine protein kinase
MVVREEHEKEWRARNHDLRGCLRLPRDRAVVLSLPFATGTLTIEPELETWLLLNLDSKGRVIGHGYQAIVRQLTSDVGELVVKSPHPNPFLGWFGRRAIQRESKAYERLLGIAGIPRSYGMADSKHLVLEHVRGPTLRIVAADLDDRESFFARLLASIQAMHAAGVAHGDLKRKENTLVGPGQTPYIIDFGVACLYSDSDGHLKQKKFELMQQMDLNAYIKLKYGHLSDQMSPEDAALHRPLLIERMARRARGPWKFLTLRKARKRRRAQKSDSN